MSNPTIEKLQEFGLSEKEAKVYFSSLELGSASVDQLSKQAGVNRSTTYVQIEQLMQAGLMSTHTVGKKTLYSPESPDNLKRLFERQQEEIRQKSTALEGFLPDLARLYDSAGERPVVRFFEGKEGLITMRSEVLKMKGKQFYAATAHDYMKSVLTQEERNEFSEQRAAKKIGGKVLYTISGDDIAVVPPLQMQRITEEEYPFESDIYIYDNKVALASLKGTVVGVIIESQAIANSMRTIFDLAWNTKR